MLGLFTHARLRLARQDHNRNVAGAGIAFKVVDEMPAVAPAVMSFGAGRRR